MLSLTQLINLYLAVAEEHDIDMCRTTRNTINCAIPTIFVSFVVKSQTAKIEYYKILDVCEPWMSKPSGFISEISAYVNDDGSYYDEHGTLTGDAVTLLSNFKELCVALL